MVRLSGRDDLSGEKGRLGGDFRASALATLHLQFMNTADDATKKRAATALCAFYSAARKLSTSESEFNRRARPAAHNPSLMNHLQGRDLAAIRAFHVAKDGLLTVNATIGQDIVNLIEKDVNLSARAAAQLQPGAPN